MKTLIIGGSAAGLRAAEQLGKDGILLTLQWTHDEAPEAFAARTGAQVWAEWEAESIDLKAKTVRAVQSETGKEAVIAYDELIMMAENVPTEPVKPTAEDIARVKGLGFLMDKRTGTTFNARVVTRNGKISTLESRAIADAAERYGTGEVTMTTRLSVEIQGVAFENIEPLRAALAQAGLETGGTGPRVRPVVSCKGTTCQYGLIDTFDLSREIHERFYKGYHDVKLPHKFKIAVGGCPNNCVKPNLNDLGIIGQRVPKPDFDKCRGCKVCRIEKACPMKASAVQNGRITLNPDRCNHCGRCFGKCPFHVYEDCLSGYAVYIGGRWGKQTAHGRMLDRIFTDRAEVLDMVEKVILFYKDNGNPGERFADTIDRIGFDKVQAQLLGFTEH